MDNYDFVCEERWHLTCKIPQQGKKEGEKKGKKKDWRGCEINQ
jgi:hypothetical protein